MMTRPRPTASLSAKLKTCFLVLLCFVLGVAGLILPIIPGLLFLAIAALIVAKSFPWTERWLRRNGRLGGYLDRTDRFLGLSFWQQTQIGGLVLLKALLDGLELAISVFARLLGFSAPKRQR